MTDVVATAHPPPRSAPESSRIAVRDALARQARWRWWEVAVFAGLVASWFVFGDRALPA